MRTNRFLSGIHKVQGASDGDAETGKPTILLVDEGISEVSPLVEKLKMIGFCCFYAPSLERAKQRLSAEVFDIVLSKLKLRGGTAYELRPLLMGRPTSLFYSLAVEQDCWWIPGVRRGTECLGEPALRPEEFFKTLVLAASEALAGAGGSASSPAN